VSCAINPISMAHQWRKPNLRRYWRRLSKKPMAMLPRHWLFSNGAPMAQRQPETRNAVAPSRAAHALPAPRLRCAQGARSRALATAVHCADHATQIDAQHDQL
jgi:hypothetical protein